MRLHPCLDTLDQLRCDAVVAFLPLGLPVRGLLSLIDWRMCFQVSDLVCSGRLHEDKPTLLADPSRVSFNRLFLFPSSESLTSATHLDVQICTALKVLSNAQLSDFVLSFPDDYPWIFDHWQRHYENHSVFRNIGIFDRMT